VTISANRSTVALFFSRFCIKFLPVAAHATNLIFYLSPKGRIKS